MSLRSIVVGYGVQGVKRRKIAGDTVVAVVDPFSQEAQFKAVQDVPLDSYDSAFVCTPDEAKFDILKFLLSNGKHVLVEKPIMLEKIQDIESLKSLSAENKAVCYTAYNHRFEPHFVKMREVISSNILGKIYHVRLFYGNGTARLVQQSPWRDKGYGVLADLGSHLLDSLLFWFENRDIDFRIVSAHRFENKAFDHLVFASKESKPFIECELSLLSWRNHFTADIFGENGTAHISSLCKWGPSTFTLRKRILPSGRPPEESTTLIQDDPTWAEEYKHFNSLCDGNEKNRTNLGNDRWIQEKLEKLYAEAEK